MRARSLAACLALAAGARSVSAQIMHGADSLKPRAIGPVEAPLYDAVRTHPRDPAPRVALGTYLLARGAPRVGTTLLEEAIKFGGDPAKIEPQLARGYLAAGDYKSLAALRSIAQPDRERAKWLVEHESRTISPDSILTVPLRQASSENLGLITIRVNGQTLLAAISSITTGVFVSDTSQAARSIHVFSSENQRAKLGVADSVGIGAMSMTNVPVMVANVAGPAAAVVGLAMLGQFAPTFDPSAGKVTLHVGMTRVPLPSGMRFATWTLSQDLQILETDGWFTIRHPIPSGLLRQRRWTFDGPAGALVIER